MRVAILSDTHGLLRPEIKEILKTCEVILHGGDINSQKILDELKEIAPVYVVRGNNDKEWAAALEYELMFTLSGLRICMVQNGRRRVLPQSGQLRGAAFPAASDNGGSRDRGGIREMADTQDRPDRARGNEGGQTVSGNQ